MFVRGISGGEQGKAYNHWSYGGNDKAASNHNNVRHLSENKTNLVGGKKDYRIMVVEF